MLLFSDLEKRMRFSSWNWKTVLPYSEQVGLNSPRWIVRFVIAQKIAIFPYYPQRPYFGIYSPVHYLKACNIYMTVL